MFTRGIFLFRHMRVYVKKRKQGLVLVIAIEAPLGTHVSISEFLSLSPDSTPHSNFLLKHWEAALMAQAVTSLYPHEKAGLTWILVST